MFRFISNAELERSLSRIEAKLDTVTTDHEVRLRRLERIMYIAIGLSLAGATSGIGTLIATMSQMAGH